MADMLLLLEAPDTTWIRIYPTTKSVRLPAMNFGGNRKSKHLIPGTLKIHPRNLGMIHKENKEFKRRLADSKNKTNLGRDLIFNTKYKTTHIRGPYNSKLISSFHFVYHSVAANEAERRSSSPVKSCVLCVLGLLGFYQETDPVRTRRSSITSGHLDLRR